MANHEQPVAPTASEDNQGSFETPSASPKFVVNPQSLTSATATFKLIVSGASGIHTSLNKAVPATPPLLQHDFATPNSMAHTAADPTHLDHVQTPSSSSGKTTILNLDPTAKSFLFNSTPPTKTVPTSTFIITSGKAQHTLATVTRSRSIAHPLPTKIAYVNSKWPQVGTIVSESDVPERWRETFEMHEMRIQYVALGAICGVFVLGVLGVLAMGWWKCWWNGECVCSRMRRKKNRERFNWYG